MIDVDALMIVAHPDDDGLFGGALQKRLAFLNWGIICLTYDLEHVRGQELLAWQTSLGTQPENIYFLNFSDDPADFEQGKSSFSVEMIKNELKPLQVRAKMVVTHNAQGEYGHPHHIDLQTAVTAIYPNSIFFGTGTDPANVTITVDDFSSELRSYYPSQSQVINETHERYGCCQVAGYIFP